MNNFWNERYSVKEYVYGEEPNVFFAEQLSKLKPGAIILPSEGEGRNAVFAASNGWHVNAFDSSEAGKIKALQLAHKKGVSIEYVVEDALTVNYPANSADVVAFIYAHFPPVTRKAVLQKATTWLKPGGKIILEAFNPNQLQNNTGGPNDVSMLYTEDIIREEFGGMKIELIQTLRTELSEGKYHEGISDIVRFVGIKE
ncbi:MAG TPA: class I SAM-dependent methyltransferase [Ginsengibacter sp.]|nr:class I SAM-dependent methyltransferase [Ginsengibacter sp.]